MAAPDGKEYKISFKLINFPNPKVRDGTYSATDRYLGNGDFEAFQAHMEKEHDRTAIVFTTVTNNSGGSQPVSLDHISKVSELCKEYNIPYIMDSCRFAENAYMIKKLDCLEESVKDIVHKIYEKVDGFTISLKKDGIVNCGGALCFCPNSPAILQFVD